jgi:hypothetical protein
MNTPDSDKRANQIDKAVRKAASEAVGDVDEKLTWDVIVDPDGSGRVELTHVEKGVDLLVPFNKDGQPQRVAYDVRYRLEITCS